ncbi:MAG: nucleotide exchange factor GrpE [Flavobacteriales bacterium]|nr:nucleotide exchange factor GrpE [Flavobacteriales bacterium]
MSERPDASPQEEVAPMASEETLSKAAEASAEHTAHDAAGLDDRELDRLRAELDARKVEHDALHDKYVRLHAEFDNFRKRTAKERMDLLMTAGADTIKRILPVLDDMERAMAHNAQVTDLEAVKQGFDLIQQKFFNTLAAQGVKAMDAKGQPFDPDLHDAVTQVAAPDPSMKGKVLEVLETGYLIHDKVLRYAKVVVGQ